MIKYLFTLIAVLGAISNASAAKVLEKPTHYIVWIHGIGGNASQAGFMKESLERFLPSQDPSMNYQVSYFDYNTKDDKLSFEDFRIAFDQYLRNKFLKETPFKKNDKFSIVAHSQGGIITFNWLRKACFDRQNPAYGICARLTSVTTLGTPVWGSRIANFAQTVKNWIGNVGIMKDYGIKQLMALSVASPAIFRLKDTFEAERMNYYGLFSKQVRLMVVAGRSSVFEALSPFFAGEKIEDDLGVPVTSSNPSYFRYSGTILGADEKTQADEIIPFRYSYAIVDAVHIPQLPNLIKENLGEAAVRWIPNISYPSLIDIPEDCVTRSPEVCNSPTLKYVASNILGVTRVIKNKPLSTFAIQLRLRGSRSEEANKYLRFKVSEANDSVKVGKWSEPYSNIRQVIGNTVYGYVTGSQIDNDKIPYNTRVVNLEIYFGMDRIHKTLLKVSPGKTSFVDLVINEKELNIMMEKMNMAPDGTLLNEQLGITEVAL